MTLSPFDTIAYTPSPSKMDWVVQILSQLFIRIIEKLLDMVFAHPNILF